MGAGAWIPADGQREELGAHCRWWPRTVLTQAKPGLVSESFQADGRLKWNKISKRRLGENVCLSGVYSPTGSTFRMWISRDKLPKV